jgi:hypothetical protein
MGLLDKASHSQTDKKSAGSLLHKADIEIKKKTVSSDPRQDKKWLTQQSFYAPPAEHDKKNSAPFITSEEKSVITKISELKEGVETPGQIYTLLKEELSIQKGAFLVQETQSEMFMPWALTGYDKTTSHRLRIPRSVVLPMFTGDSPSCLYINSEDSMAFLRPFFSIREFGLLEKVILCPFFFKQEILGFLLISDSPILEDDSKERALSFIYNLAKAASPVLYHTREKKLERLSLHQPAVKSDIAGELIKIFKMSKNEHKEMILILFSVQEAARQIQQHVADAELFRIQHDLTGILTSMLCDAGGVLALNESTLLLIVSGKSMRDETLLIHQISLALNDFTQKPLETSNLIKDTLLNPKNEKELIQFIEKWI